MFCRGFFGYGYGAPGTFSNGWFFLAMGLRMLIFVGLIVLTIKFIKGYSHKNYDSIRILDERFARGEISEEEYIKRKSVLSQKN